MSYNNPRVKIEMSMMDIIMELSEGNPGALRVLMECVKNNPSIDPDCAFGPLGPMLAFDNLDCYGPRIWMLFKDVCGQDLRRMLGVMRASQLGFTSDTKINAAIDGDRAQLDIPDLLRQVKERLPAFQIESPESVAA